MTKPSRAGRWIGHCSSAAAVISCCLALQGVAGEPGERHRQLEESLSKSEAARSIQQSYVPGLELRAKTAAQAMEILLIEGFRCGLRAPDDVPIFKEDAMRVSCTQDESKIHAECPTLTLELNAQWLRVVATRPEMLDQLGSAKIKSITARCPVPMVGAAEFAGQQKRAEKSLEQEVRQAALIGTTAKQAFDRLIANGFDCGIDPVGQRGSTLNASLACRRLPSRVQGCFEAELLLGMRWKQPHRTREERVGDLQGATVQRITSQCRLPPMTSDHRA